MIPQANRQAVSLALSETFGSSDFDDIVTIKNLASSMVFRIMVRGRPYLLKISTRTNDPARHYGCMKAAADAGIAPRVWYAGVQDRISIEDFVPVKPFPRKDAVTRVAAALRALHVLPLFAGRPEGINTTCTYLMNQGPAVDGFFQAFRKKEILPQAECEELLARHAQIAAAYKQHGPDLASSHNDLFKPDNILFDGERAWLIDWEAAFSNDRYADLAAAANLVAGSDDDEQAFLREYFGKEPSEYQQARFFLMQQLVHMFYGTVFLLQGSAGKPIDFSRPVPSFREFHQAMWAGEADLADIPAKAVLGRVHWEQFTHNTRHPGFDKALGIVAQQP